MGRAEVLKVVSFLGVAALGQPQGPGVIWGPAYVGKQRT